MQLASNWPTCRSVRRTTKRQRRAMYAFTSGSPHTKRRARGGPAVARPLAKVGRRQMTSAVSSSPPKGQQPARPTTTETHSPVHTKKINTFVNVDSVHTEKRPGLHAPREVQHAFPLGVVLGFVPDQHPDALRGIPYAERRVVVRGPPLLWSLKAKTGVAEGRFGRDKTGVTARSERLTQTLYSENCNKTRVGAWFADGHFVGLTSADVVCVYLMPGDRQPADEVGWRSKDADLRYVSYVRSTW